MSDRHVHIIVDLGEGIKTKAGYQKSINCNKPEVALQGRI
jgi:hypothetical protein